MTDKDFLDEFITERMQMHYSLHKGNMKEGEPANSLRLEKEYAQALETLPTATREAIENFVKCLFNKAADDESFFYVRGLKDGLLLYELLDKL